MDQRQKSTVFSLTGAEIPRNVLATKGVRRQDLKRFITTYTALQPILVHILKIMQLCAILKLIKIGICTVYLANRYL